MNIEYRREVLESKLTFKKSYKMTRLCFYILITCLIFSCKKKEEEIPVDVIPPVVDQVPTIIPDGTEQYLNLDSDYIFDQEKLHTFEIKLPQSALNKIDGDPAAEEYVEGSLIFEGDTISPVGIRYKGSIGAFVGCLSGNDWANPSGYKTCTKLSLKIKINWGEREEKFYGLKKIQLHAMNNDDSQMRDRLAYWLFREMGVPAPRSVHAKVMINGMYSGVYALVEQVDGRFARYNFDDGKGNMYKEIWPLKMSGQPHSAQSYLNHLETNTDENPSANMMRTFAQDIAAADDNSIKDVIADWMNVDEIISYAVVDRTIRVDDGPFHWYCSGGGCESHNFFWYEETAAGKMHLIPWDMDNTFENILFNANPVTPIADGWGEISNNCQPFSSGLFGLQQWSAACDKLTGGWVKFEDEFDQLKTQFVEGPLSESQTNLMLDTWADQIRDATLQAKEEHSDAVAESSWNSAILQLKSQLKFAREN